jgi:hypothetical protein
MEEEIIIVHKKKNGNEYYSVTSPVNIAKIMEIVKTPIISKL